MLLVWHKLVWEKAITKKRMARLMKETKIETSSWSLTLEPGNKILVRPFFFFYYQRKQEAGWQQPRLWWPQSRTLGAFSAILKSIKIYLFGINVFVLCFWWIFMCFKKFHRCGMTFEIRLFFLFCDQLCPPCLTSRPSLVNLFWKANWLIPIHGNCSNCILAGLARQNGGRKTVLAVASFSIAHY